MPKTLPRQANQVLGFNARALFYTGLDDARKARKTAHNKLSTKRLLQRAGLPTPRLHAIINSRQELKKFRWTKLPSSFVIKPNTAYGGSGIIVIFGRNKKGNWVHANKTETFIPQLKSHVLDILDGNFSPSNIPDTVLFEQRVKIHPDLKPYSVRGVPDVRIIIYNLVPIMAMLRLSTSESRGRANLHAGGIGLGIDLARGFTTTAIYRGFPIDTLPGTRLHLSGVRMPYWDKTLLTASQAAKAANLPFAGVDLAIDRDDGPVVLEINAYPGLGIQLANMAPLRSRLKRVEGLAVSTPQRAIRISKNLFGDDIEQEIEDLSGHTVLGITEPVQITDSSGNKRSILAKIDTGAWRTTIDKSLAKKFDLHTNILDKKEVRGALGQESRPVVEISMTVRDHTIRAQAYLADRSHLKYDMIIGRRDLKGFLVDPYKNTRRPSATSKKRSAS